VILWSAVGSGAPHRSSFVKRVSEWEKRRRRFALAAQSKMVRGGESGLRINLCPEKIGSFVALLKGTNQNKL